MPYSSQSVVSDGTLVLLDVSIKYFDRSEISVLFNDELQVSGWSWVGTSESKLAFAPAVPTGTVVKVQRKTMADSALHLFDAGAAFTAGSMDENFEQIIRVAQEMQEGVYIGTDLYNNLDMHGSTLNNLADAVLAQQPVTYKQLLDVGYGAAELTEEYTATGGQTMFALTKPYTVGTGNLSVFINGVRQDKGTAYYETTSTLVTFTEGLAAGDYVQFFWAVAIASSGLTAVELREDLASSDPAKGAAMVGFVQSGTGAVARSARDKLRESVSLQDFGAVGDGITDDTSAIQLAINSGAKRIISQAGKQYLISNTIAVDVDAVEIDFVGAELLLDDTTGLKSHMKLGNGSTQRGGIKIRNITFTRQQVATAGYAIDSDLIGVCEISGCRIYGNNEIWRGIRVYRGIIINVQNNYIDNCINRGILIRGSGGGSNRAVDVTLRENRVEGGVTAVEASDFVEGLFCRDNVFFNTSGTCFVIDASTNANGLVSFKLQDNDFDTAGVAGLYIDKVNNVQICDNWFSNISGDCILIKESVDGVVVDGNQLYPSAQGVVIYGDNVRVTSNIILGGTNSIALTSSADRASVVANTMGNAQYGVVAGSAPNLHLANNTIQSMSVGTISGTAGSGSVIQGNKGDSGVGGNSYITVGASPFTYTAGQRPEYVSIFAGTVSQIALSNVNIAFSTDKSVVLSPGQTVTVTYSSIPYMIKNQL